MMWVHDRAIQYTYEQIQSDCRLVSFARKTLISGNVTARATPLVMSLFELDE